jgi:hypothetical protein
LFFAIFFNFFHVQLNANIGMALGLKVGDHFFNARIPFFPCFIHRIPIRGRGTQPIPLILSISGNGHQQGGWRLNWTLLVRPKWAFRTDFAHWIIHAFFMRASVDFLNHRHPLDTFPPDDLKPSVLQINVVPEIGVGRFLKPLM